MARKRLRISLICLEPRMGILVVITVLEKIKLEEMAIDDLLMTEETEIIHTIGERREGLLTEDLTTIVITTAAIAVIDQTTTGTVEV